MDLIDPLESAIAPGNRTRKHQTNNEHIHVVQVPAAANLHTDDQANHQKGKQRQNNGKFLPDS